MFTFRMRTASGAGAVFIAIALNIDDERQLVGRPDRGNAAIRPVGKRYCMLALILSVTGLW